MAITLPLEAPEIPDLHLDDADDEEPVGALAEEAG